VPIIILLTILPPVEGEGRGKRGGRWIRKGESEQKGEEKMGGGGMTQQGIRMMEFKEQVLEMEE
jgi:hypothetical protein